MLNDLIMRDPKIPGRIAVFAGSGVPAKTLTEYLEADDRDAARSRISFHDGFGRHERHIARLG